MTRSTLTSLALVFGLLVPLHADLTLTQTVSIEGGMAAMAPAMTPKMTTRIKGLKARTDVEVMDQTFTTLTDLATRQLIVLNAGGKTAQVFGAGGAQLPGAAALPAVDLSFKPTGGARVIEGAKCLEHAFTLSVDMAQAGASGQMPGDAAAMMKDVRLVMNGSVWVAADGPGVADYTTFQKAAAEANLTAALGGIIPGQTGGMERLVAAAASAPGLPYLTEMVMTFEGTGQLVQVMKGMGPMKITQRVTAVSTDPLPDDLFAVPAGYEVVKQ